MFSGKCSQKSYVCRFSLIKKSSKWLREVYQRKKEIIFKRIDVTLETKIYNLYLCI